MEKHTDTTLQLTTEEENTDQIGQPNDYSVPEEFTLEAVNELLGTNHTNETDQVEVEAAIIEGMEKAEEEAEEEAEVELNLDGALSLIDHLKAELAACEARSKEKAEKKATTLTPKEQAFVDGCATPAEAALELKMDARDIRKEIRAGTLNATKVGGRWYIEQTELDRIQKDAKDPKAEKVEELEVDELGGLEIQLDPDQIEAISSHEELVEAVKELD